VFDLGAKTKRPETKASGAGPTGGHGDGGAGGSKKRLGRALSDQEDEYGDQRGIQPPVR